MAEAALLLPNATRDLARFAARLQFEDIPSPVIAHAKLCVLMDLGTLDNVDDITRLLSSPASLPSPTD